MTKPTEPPAPVYWPKTIVFAPQRDRIICATIHFAQWDEGCGWSYSLDGWTGSFAADDLRADFTSALILHGQLKERAGLR